MALSANVYLKPTKAGFICQSKPCFATITMKLFGSRWSLIGKNMITQTEGQLMGLSNWVIEKQW